MKSGLVVALVIGLAVLWAGMVLAQDVNPADEIGQMDRTDRALVRIVILDQADLTRVEASGVQIYARLNSIDGIVLLAGGDPEELRALDTERVDVHLLDPELDADLDSDIPDRDRTAYYIAYLMPGRGRPAWESFGQVLYEEAAQAILRMTPADARRLAEAGCELRAVTLDPKPIRDLCVPSLFPTAITPDSLVQVMIDEVDSLTIYTYTGDLSGEWPVTVGGSSYTIATRYTYSGTPIDKATQYVGEHLEGLGLAAEYHVWEGSSYPNVIGEITGEVSPDSIVIICGHVDDMPSGPLAPGADDNASGVAAVLVAADIMTQYKWHYTVRFAAWTGEEQGLWGSYYYAERCYNEGEAIVGVLNLDMIGYNSPGDDPDIDLHADSSIPGTMDLAQLFADVVDAYGFDLIPEIVPNGTGASDHASFWDYGYVAILGIEDFGDFNPRYHTTGDQLQYLDMSYYVEFVKASLGTFAHMAGVYVDLGGVDEVADGERLPAATRLHRGYPNPTSSSTVIRYDIAGGTGAELKVFDAQGRFVKTLAADYHTPGQYEVTWAGENERGERCSPGVYFYRLALGDGSREMRKLVLLR